MRENPPEKVTGPDGQPPKRIPRRKPAGQKKIILPTTIKGAVDIIVQSMPEEYRKVFLAPALECHDVNQVWNSKYHVLEKRTLKNGKTDIRQWQSLGQYVRNLFQLRGTGSKHYYEHHPLVIDAQENYKYVLPLDYKYPIRSPEKIQDVEDVSLIIVTLVREKLEG